MKIIISLNKPTITKKDIKSIERLTHFSSFSDELTKKFEQNFASYVGRKYALSVSSGTAALHLALLSLGIKENDEVICPSYTCVALLNAISYVKAKAVLVDCNFDLKNSDFNISLPDLKEKISIKTKAIIVPHMFGYPAKIDEIIKLGIPIIEDATQALGGSYKNKKLGSFGEISIFSLHSSKMMTTGVGGMIVTDSEKLLNKAKFFGDYGSSIISRRLENESTDYQVQYNYMTSDLNSLLGISQLNQIDNFTKKRIKIAKTYSKAFNNIAEVPLVFDNNVFWRYMVKIKKNPVNVIKEAKEHGIELGRGVFPAIHQYLKLEDSLFPNTKKAIDSLIAIPLYPSLSFKEQKYLIKAVKKIIS